MDRLLREERLILARMVAGADAGWRAPSFSFVKLLEPLANLADHIRLISRVPR